MVQITPLTASDTDDLLDLNTACVPHVNEIAAGEVAAFLRQSHHCIKAQVHDKTAGYVIALPTGCDYQSPNYQYFVAHYPRFLYIDRIMVKPDFRRHGVASALYRWLDERAADIGASVLTCEVNVKPPNPDSMALHLGLGFKEVGRQQTEQGKKEVALLAKTLT